MTTLRTLAADARPRSHVDWSSDSQIAAENLFFEQAAIACPQELGDAGSFHDDHLKATCEERIDGALKALADREIDLDAELAVTAVQGRGPVTLRDLADDALSIDEDDRDSERQEKAIALFREACATADSDLVDDDRDEIMDDDGVRAMLDTLERWGLADTVHEPRRGPDVAAIRAVIAAVEAATTAGGALDAIPEAWIVNLLGPTDLDGFAAMIVPEGDRGPAHRLERRGLTTGRGADRLEALRNSARWLGSRLSI